MIKVKRIEAIKGIYGTRLIVPKDCKDLNVVLKALSIWGGSTGYDDFTFTYEFTEEVYNSDIMKLVLQRFNVVVE